MGPPTPGRHSLTSAPSQGAPSPLSRGRGAPRTTPDGRDWATRSPGLRCAGAEGRRGAISLGAAGSTKPVGSALATTSSISPGRILPPLAEGPSRRDTSQMSTRERFMHFVVVGNDSECWDWSGTLVGGYGQFSAGGVTHCAHRYAYEASVGELPEWVQVDHTCHNRACVNLEHLREATNKQNQENRAPGSRASSGFRNVYLRPSGKYVVSVRSDGVDHYGGYYADLGEAITAAMRLRDKLFTHHRRGSYD